MRGGAAAALAASILVAGCASIVRDAPPEAPVPETLAPPLPEDVALEGATLVSREATRAVFRWEGVVGPAEVAPLVGQPAGAPSVAEAALRLPAATPMRVDVRLHWNGTTDLDLFVEDGDVERCASVAQRGGPTQPVVGEEACAAWAEPGPARAWTVIVENEIAGVGEATPFELFVTVRTHAPVARYDLAQGPAPRASAPDPLLPGALDVATAEYDFGTMVVEDPATKRPYAVRVLGAAHFPLEEGAFPLVVLMHGRHQTCEGPTDALDAFSHCRAPAGAGANVPSHRGYDDAAQLLASHGYVVASIDANDINALDTPGSGVPPGDTGMQARAQLILRTLDELRGVHERGGAPANAALDPLRGRLDLARIGLMGHSRGAEAVTRAPSYAEEAGHWSAGSILAVYSLAGATRDHLDGYETRVVRAPVAYAAVSAYCDGDAWWIANLEHYDLYKDRDHRGPLVHLLFMGANHNYYNAAWPQDDAWLRWLGDPYCGPDGVGYGRLAIEDQLAHQRAYLTAFFRLHLGGEADFAPLLAGEAPPPSGACPATLDACPGLVHASVQPPPARMRSIEDATTDASLAANDLGGASAFEGFDDVAWCDPREEDDASPCARRRTAGFAPRLLLAWSADAAWRTGIPSEHADLRAFDTLAFRIGVEFDDEAIAPGGIAPRVTLVLEDADGKRAETEVADHTAAVFAPPGHESRRVALNQARVPLDAFAGVDLARVAAVELRFSGATPGAVHVADLAALDL